VINFCYALRQIPLLFSFAAFASQSPLLWKEFLVTHLNFWLCINLEHLAQHRYHH